MEDAHTKTVEETLTFFNVDDEKGLSDEQVQQSQEKYGPNGKRRSTQCGSGTRGRDSYTAR